MEKVIQRAGYAAPRMEATSFKTENGYATSETPSPTKSFTLNIGQGGL